MVKDSENNQFLSIIYDLYDEIRFGNKNDTVEEVVKKKSILYKIPFVKKLLSKDSDDSIFNSFSLYLFIRTLKTQPPSFEILWDFCEFIRVCEKVFFYKNVPENDIYVEADLSDSTKQRKIQINFGDSKIKLVLTRSILSSNVIDIKVIREYGLKMENYYRVTDSNMEYEDSSDLYLINEINRLLQDRIVFVFEGMIKLISHIPSNLQKT